MNFLQKNYIQQANEINSSSLLAQTSHENLIKLLVKKNVLESMTHDLPNLLKKYVLEIEKDYTQKNYLVL